MNLKNIFVAGAVVSSFCFTTARAELVWEKKELELHPAIGAAEAVAVFKYENKGDKAIHINSTKTSCGCTVAALEKNDVAPGEKGEVKATFKIGDRSGLQTKTITVDTNDTKEPTTILTLKANITQLLEIQPAFVLWTAGEEPKAKTVLAKAGKGVKMKGLDVTSSSTDFTAKVEPGAAEGEFKINVQPRDTKHATGATLTVKPDTQEASAKLFYVTAQVTTPAPPAPPAPPITALSPAAATTPATAMTPAAATTPAVATSPASSKP